MPAALLTALLSLACASPGPRDGARVPLVDVLELEPSIRVDIRYATPENFTGKVLYPVNRCLLRRPVAERLAGVQRALRGRGLALKVWDCYRPLSIQRELWALVPDPRYVADPVKGSRHNRGAAVDLTLVDGSGAELEMPTGYDDFSERAHRGHAGASPRAAANSALLESALARAGFAGLATEWWHFDADGWREYPLEDVPLR